MSNFKSGWYSAGLFGMGIFLGTLITLSASNWALVWAGMELNMMSFLGWACTSGSASMLSAPSWAPVSLVSYYPPNVEPFAKYFLAQAVGTALFLFCPLVWSISYLSMYTAIFMLFGMFMKGGVAPFHQWFPSVCSNVSWKVNMVLMFWQKIAPLYVIAGVTMVYDRVFLVVSIMNLFFGGFGALGQTQMRSLFAYSSISHMGWMMALLYFSKVGFFFYFLLYGLMVVPVAYIFHVMGVYSFLDMGKVSKYFYIYFLLMVVVVLGMSGMPPFTGFFMKAYSVYLMLCMGFLGLALVFCGFAVISLSYYIGIIFISLLLRVLVGHEKSLGGGYNLKGFMSAEFSFQLGGIGFFVMFVAVSLPFIGVLVV